MRVTLVRLGHFGPFGSLWSVRVTLVRSGHVAQFEVYGDTGPGFMGLLVYEFTVYWFIGLWVYGCHGSIDSLVHGLTGLPINGFTGLRIHRAAFRARRCDFASRRSGEGDALGFMRSP